MSNFIGFMKGRENFVSFIENIGLALKGTMITINLLSKFEVTLISKLLKANQGLFVKAILTKHGRHFINKQ